MPNPYEETRRKLVAARKAFRSTDYGQLVRDVDRLSRKRQISQSEARSLQRRIDRYAKSGGSEAKKLVESLGVGGNVDTQSLGSRVFSGLLRKMGPLGSLFNALLRPGGQPLAEIDKELAAAKGLLEAFGYTGEAPTTRRQQPPPLPKQKTRPARPEHYPPLPQTEERGRKLRTRTGIRRYADDDPILTGEMIEVASSNVHSIGYIWNEQNPHEGTLQVRFLQAIPGRRGATRPGPLYYYHRVNPQLFEAFQRAQSKGVFVWDKLRIRGTVSGHRYHYELKGISGGYMPRQAVRYGGNEYFVRRQKTVRMRDGSRKTIQSQLEDRKVRSIEPIRGFPRRGRD